MATRRIKRIVRGAAMQDGAGVKLTRVIGGSDVYDFDPFLMLDVIDSADPGDYVAGFPAHPHRGMETVTYLVEGEVEYRDSTGNDGVIRSGGCQWVTAGSGIIHRELPKRSPRLLGLQLWINLPRRDKMTPPKCREAAAGDVPNVATDGGTVRVLSGSYGSTVGAFGAEHVRATLLDVDLLAGAKLRIATPRSATACLYVFEGSGKFSEADEIAIQKNAVLFTEGDEIAIRAGGTGTRLFLCVAEALREPVAWGGPIVMNTELEVEEALYELRNGTFLKEEKKGGEEKIS